MSAKVLDWTWIFMLQFFIVAIIDIQFAIIGILFVVIPIIYSWSNKKYIYCNQYCPQGSLLKKFLSKISFQRTLPQWATTDEFKLILTVFVLCCFVLSIHFSGYTFIGIAFATFRLITSLTLISIVMGVIYKPQAWCEICPFGNIVEVVKKNAS